jgi:hypothetical protein
MSSSPQNNSPAAGGATENHYVFASGYLGGGAISPQTRLRHRIEDRRATVTDGASLRSRLYSSAAAPGRTGAAP